MTVKLSEASNEIVQKGSTKQTLADSKFRKESDASSTNKSNLKGVSQMGQKGIGGPKRNSTSKDAHLTTSQVKKSSIISSNSNQTPSKVRNNQNANYTAS